MEKRSEILSTEEEIIERFSSHKCDAEGVEKMRAIRKSARYMARQIGQLCPPGRDRATALTQLAFAMYSANAAISTKHPVDPMEVDQ